MSTVTIRPTSTLNASTGTKVGGATAHACLGDNNDASWVEMWPEAGVARVGIPAPTKPAGSMTKHIRSFCRVSSISVNTTKFDHWFEYASTVGIYGQVIDGTDVEQWSTAWTDVGDVSAAWFTGVVLGIRRSLTGMVTNLRAREVALEVVFALQPTTTIDSVTVGTTSTTVNWSHTAGEDGGGQSWYRANLWNSAGSMVYDTGVQASGATSATATGLAAGTYEWRVATAQSVNGRAHWAANDTEAAVIVAPEPEDPEVPAVVASIVATPDPLQAVVEIEVTRDTDWDNWGTVDIERLSGDVLSISEDIESGTGGVADGWTTTTGNTPTGLASSIEAGGESGNFQRFTAALDSNDFYRFHLDDTMACSPGQLILLKARIKSSKTGGDPFPRITVAFLATAPGPFTSVNVGWAGISYAYSDLPVSGSWATARVVATVPAAARSFSIGMEACNIGASGTLAVDFDLVEVIVSSDDWTDVRHVPTPNADDVTAYDYEAPPDQLLHYRARASNSDGEVAGTWVYADPVEWTADDLWLTPVSSPAERATFKLAVPPSRERVRREQRLNILGAKLPVYRSDVLLGSEGEFVVITATEAEADALEAIAEHGVVVVHAPAAYRFPSGYYRLGSLQEVHLSRPTAVQHRRWRLPFTECRRP